MIVMPVVVVVVVVIVVVGVVVAFYSTGCGSCSFGSHRYGSCGS